MSLSTPLISGNDYSDDPSREDERSSRAASSASRNADRSRLTSFDEELGDRVRKPSVAQAQPTATFTEMEVDDSNTAKEDSEKTKRILIYFALLVVIGLGNKIFNVLQTYPMNNYPLYLNLLNTFVFVPLCFAYIWIIPYTRWSHLITDEARNIPTYKFAVMGLLDSLAGILQTLATTYLVNGSLIILLSQAVIPVSMVVSFIMLRTRYSQSQIIGALVVTGAVALVVTPRVSGGGDTGGSKAWLWVLLMVISAVPQCLSSVYKEKALGETEIDVVYLNGWVALYQFIVALPLLLPSAPLAGVSISDLPRNLWDGQRCFVGVNSVASDDCYWGALYVVVYLVFNIFYNIIIVLILKHAGANVLFLAMTIIVPLADVAFSFDFMPKHEPLNWEDIVGLFLIIIGLVIYRFYPLLHERYLHPFYRSTKDLLLNQRSAHRRRASSILVTHGPMDGFVEDNDAL